MLIFNIGTVQKEKQSLQDFKLYVLKDYKGNPNTIQIKDLVLVSETVTLQMVNETVNSFNWNNFNVIELINDNEAISVSGNFNFGFNFGYRNFENETSEIKQEYPKSVNEISKILTKNLLSKE